MEERLRGGGDYGGVMSWGHDPPLSGSVAVHLYIDLLPSFYRHADCNGCMLQVANVAYQSL